MRCRLGQRNGAVFFKDLAAAEIPGSRISLLRKKISQLSNSVSGPLKAIRNRQ
jgi:hypothetical protein